MEKWESQRGVSYAHIRYGREERHHKNGRSPSFSSALLDAICKSTEDEGSAAYRKSREEARTVESCTRTARDRRGSRIERETCARQWSQPRWPENGTVRPRSAEIGVFEAEKYFTGYEFESLRRSAISELHPSLSSATSCSSETSENASNWPFSSSDAESLYRSTAGYGSDRPRAARSLAGWEEEGACRWPSRKAAGRECCEYNAKSKCGAMQDEPFVLAKSKSVKSKSKFSYKDAKKPKQPISPGSKLANFLNSLFMAGGAKKAKLSAAASSSESNSCANYSSERKPSYASSSSSSVHSRSCLSKGGAGSNGGGARRTVTFYPTSIVVDEDSRPCGQKYLHRIENPSPEPNPNTGIPLLGTKLKLRLLEEGNRSAAQEILARYQKANTILEAVVSNLEQQQEEEEEEEEDDASCCSADLFELENLAATEMSLYQKELPVYETTHLETNKAIAEGLLI